MCIRDSVKTLQTHGAWQREFRQSEAGGAGIVAKEERIEVLAQKAGMLAGRDAAGGRKP